MALPLIPTRARSALPISRHSQPHWRQSGALCGALEASYVAEEHPHLHVEQREPRGARGILDESSPNLGHPAPPQAAPRQRPRRGIGRANPGPPEPRRAGQGLRHRRDPLGCRS
eukprot:scaffold1890_cov105-Isochrysis_galbana.AAC.1